MTRTRIFGALVGLSMSLLAAMPAAAATTGWIELGEGARIRLIADNQLDDTGHTRLGLEIEMPPTVKTYWQQPGEAGLPLALDWKDTSGIATTEVLWPYPLREKDKGFLEYVYYGDTTLPILVELEPGTTRLDVDLAITMGVCSEVCIPAQAAFSTTLDFGKPDRASAFRLDRATNLVPKPAQEDPAFAQLGIAPSGEAVWVKTTAGRSVNASLVISAQSNEFLFGTPQNGPHSDILEVPFLGYGKLEDLIGQPLGLTYLGTDGPLVVTRPLGRATMIDTVVRFD
ncbi:protein-disulfide reductase DsbD domain-containing protein [Cucumibacter marinus]|uniref:protein-disulfide reductase DsbD domain-containing protein n=1 Tax=Cucumibacter marinus TaxID=1121252 RepID=UPI00048AFA07|nr:protein-disulfide reductase DsbD domain-containing protein [Cucumibacter marinus]